MFILNLFVWAQASSTAIPFGTLVGLAALWLLIQVPLVYAGSWYGYVRAEPWNHPTKTNTIARQIPPQSWHTRSASGALLAGLVPFAVLFIELMFVFKSLWQDRSGYYYVFGFLSVISTILIITISEVTIIATYIQLCSEVRDETTPPPPCQKKLSLSTDGRKLKLTHVPELPLVVAELLRRRCQCVLDLRLLHVVLRHAVAH